MSEKAFDAAVHHRIGLGRYSSWLVRRILAQLNHNERAIVAKVAEMGPDGASAGRLELLIEALRLLQAEGWLVIKRRVTEDLAQLAGAEAEFAAKLVRFTGARGTFSPAPAVAQVWAAVVARPFQGRFLQGWLDGAEEAAARRVRETVRQGFIDGQPTAEIVRALRGTKARQYRDGVLEGSRRGVEAMVRTAVTHTSNVAHQEVYRANADIIEGVEWVSVLDSRTTLLCFPGSTRIVPLGELRAVVKRPYHGDVVIITTASGKEVRATPNHPVLTARGWRPANEVRPGADVLYRLRVDSRDILGAEDVDVPAGIAELADAIAQLPGVDVEVQRTAQADFHGDGQVADCHIYRAGSACDLRDGLEAARPKQLEDRILATVQASRRLTREGEAHLVGLAHALGKESAEREAVPSRDCVEGRLTHAGACNNVHRLGAGIEHGDDPGLVGAAAMLLAADGGHDASSLQKCRDGRCGGVVGAPDLRGGDAVAIEADDVVAVRREFFAGHVYNLQTGLGMYIADGFVVHNCASRDGKVYPIDSGPRPPAHVGCRSVTVPKVGDIPGVEPFKRPTYAEWLAKQPASVQDDILGPTRGRLYRSGGLKVESFVDRKGSTLSLEELQRRDAAAFQRAGVSA